MTDDNGRVTKKPSTYVPPLSYKQPFLEGQRLIVLSPNAYPTDVLKLMLSFGYQFVSTCSDSGFLGNHCIVWTLHKQTGQNPLRGLDKTEG